MSPSLFPNLNWWKGRNLHDNDNISHNQQSEFYEIEESKHQWLFVEVQTIPNFEYDVDDSNQ